jgi:ribose transport system substrate-binding protein
MHEHTSRIAGLCDIVDRNMPVEAVLRACELLRSFRSDGELLRLRDIVQRTGLPKSTTHRILRTLQKGGLVESAGADQYRCLVRSIERQRRLRIGFGAQTTSSTFSHVVSESVRRAAVTHGVDLVEVNNRYSSKTALRNADLLIRERVDVAIEFQTYENVAPVIAARFLSAGIPVIAVEIPHPGAVYFGANNYEAGLIGGRALGKWAKENWTGVVDEIILIEERIAGPLPQSRLTGAMTGLREVLPDVSRANVVQFDGKGAYGPTFDLMRKHLRKQSRRRTLVAAINDPSALGALRAFEECGCSSYCAVMGQNAIAEARDELRRPSSRLIGSVAYFPERYGQDLIPLALAMAAGKQPPTAIFTKHKLITPKNVDEVYPPEKALAAGR